ncbi:uncharacterized protein LOC101165676 [Oryzias latipes]|uniref:Retinoic acid receptor responder protein 2 n=1 Tax=Oryzias latipes TaxID=8090 RepID=A0A3B3HF27_ORYLA|nr:uncharacterized protein LOC101165676 [Oryzias latipes]
MAALMLWLLGVGVLFLGSDAQEAYDDLPEILRIGVDLALTNVNNHSSIQQHFLFFNSVSQMKEELGFNLRYISHHFNLKATDCQRGVNDTSECQFRNDRPLIDCLVCYKTFEGEIENPPTPYLHCIHKPKLTEEMRRIRAEQCSRMEYRRGSATLLGVVDPQKRN